MHPIDWLVVAASLGLVLGQGLWFARGQNTNEEYYLGGRRMNWLIVGVSMFAATFSPLSFVGLPRAAAYEDYHLFLAILFIPLFATPIVMAYFVPLYYRLKLTSAYEYLGRRFSPEMRRAGSVLNCVYTIGWMGNILFATALIVQAALELEDWRPGMIILGAVTITFTAIGGFRGMVWANTVQSLLLVGGILVVLGLALARIDGGAAEVLRLGVEHQRFDMFDMQFHWRGKVDFYAACAFGAFVYLAASAVTQPAVQRIVSMPSVAAARRSLMVRALLVAAVCLVFFWLGTTLFAFYIQHPDAQARPGSVFPPLEREDQLTTHFVRTQLAYPGLLGILLVGLFAAAMNTISSGISSLAALVVADWLPGREMGVRFNRILVTLAGLATVGAALVMPYLGKNVFDILMKISGGCYGPLLGMFLLGMLFRRANTEGVEIGLTGGLVALVAAAVLDISQWWYGAITCLATIGFGLVGSLCFPPPHEHKVRGLLIAASRSVH